ncbi:hypothetical protein CCS38_11030 [Streptomyces purpurogeneiscleroticus]|nr:hypothetical protein [Streptomyces purpurogeneiscleroticus]
MDIVSQASSCLRTASRTCSILRATSQYRIPSDAVRAGIARRIVAATGIAPEDAPGDRRWVAVRHANFRGLLFAPARMVPLRPVHRVEVGRDHRSMTLAGPAA